MMNARQKPLSGPLAEIEALTKAFAEERATLNERVSSLNAARDEVTRMLMPGIKHALAKAAECQAQLKAAIEAAPAAFEKPRSHIFHGIKVGYRKGAGKVTYADADQVVKLIWLRFPADRAAALIKTTEKPNKEAIADLDVSELMKIGCAIESTGDVVEIKPVDSDVDKIVTALLKEATDETEGE